MEHYIGLDVSNKTVSVCVIDNKGTIIDERELCMHAPDVLTHLASWKATVVHVGFEAGQLAPWLYHTLKEAGYPAVCLEVRHMSAAIKAQAAKTDRNDARGMAQMLRLGWYKATHVKSPEMQKIRMLLTHRKHLDGQVLGMMNTVRGSLKAFGIRLGNVGHKVFAETVREKIACDNMMGLAIEPLLSALETLQKSLAAMDATVKKLAREDTVCRKLMTVPGIGPVNALTFKATIEDPARFSRARDIGPYLGLVPRKYASGQIDHNGHITKTGDRMLRCYLFEAALNVLTRLKRDCPLRTWGRDLAKRSSLYRAAVAVARKLAMICLSVWRKDTEFTWPDVSAGAKTA